jgi:outer membrane protein TolC
MGSAASPNVSGSPVADWHGALEQTVARPGSGAQLRRAGWARRRDERPGPAGSRSSLCAPWHQLLVGALLCLVPLRAVLVRASAADNGALTLPLATAIATALRVSPQVRQAADLRTAGRYGARAGRASLLPRLSLVVGHYWDQTRDGQPLYVAANGPHETIGLLELSLPLYSPQLLALARLARDQEALARSEQAQARLGVAAQVADAWYQLALLHARVRIWKSTLRSVDILYRGTRQKYAVGTAAVLDLAQTELLRHNAESGLQQARAQRRAAAHVLDVLLGRTRSARIVLPVLRPTSRPLPTEPLWIGLARRAQPLLRIAARQIAVGDAQAGTLRATRLPTITADVDYGVDTVPAPRPGDLGWQVFLGLSMPIFNFGAQRDRIADAEARVAALRAARRSVLLQIRATIAHDYGAARAAERVYRQAVKQRRDARAVYAMTRDGYQAGTLNALDLAQAENSWLQARLRVATALVVLRMAHTQLRLDTGTYPGERSAT